MSVANFYITKFMFEFFIIVYISFGNVCKIYLYSLKKILKSHAEKKDCFLFSILYQNEFSNPPTFALCFAFSVESQREP